MTQTSQPPLATPSQPASPAPDLPPRNGRSRALSSLLNSLGPLLGLLLVYGFFAVFAPHTFRSSSTLISIANQTVVVAIAALGATLVIIAGGIDLSVGSLVALVTVVVAWFLGSGGDHTVLGHTFHFETLDNYPLLWPVVAALAGVLAGTLCGFINGSLIAGLRVVPFIITLGTLLTFRAFGKQLANEQKIDADLSWLNNLLGTLPHNMKWMVLPPGIWTLIALSLLTAALLRYTRLGRHIFAIGSNEQTARLCGIAVNRVKLIVYSLAGLFAGIAGVMQFARLSVGDPTVAVGLELDVIAACVIGGASLNGGEGSILGTLVGALIMTTIKVGCSFMGLSNPVQEEVTGLIIIIAVALDRLRHRRTA